MVDKRALGRVGENKGVDFLEKIGYKILEKNFYARRGEVDIIAEHESDLVFIEVKFRQSNEYGMPQDAIKKYKQRRIVKSALEYIKSNRNSNQNIRFDVLLIGPEPERIELIKSAFITSGKYMY